MTSPTCIGLHSTLAAVEPDALRIIGADLADRYGTRSAKADQVRYREPCAICQHPSGDCAHHPPDPPPRYPVVNTEPPAVYPDNPPRTPTDGRVLGVDEEYEQAAVLGEPVYYQWYPDGSSTPACSLLVGAGQVPSQRLLRLRNEAIRARQAK